MQKEVGKRKKEERGREREREAHLRRTFGSEKTLRARADGLAWLAPAQSEFNSMSPFAQFDSGSSDSAYNSNNSSSFGSAGTRNDCDISINENKFDDFNR